MLRTTRTSHWAVSVAVLTLCAIGLVVAAPAAAQAPMTVNIEISPKMIYMSSLGGSVSIHADIPLRVVDRGSIVMEGLRPYLVKADARGDLVAKFNLDDVKEIVSPPETTMTILGMTIDGTPFSGTDVVRVRQ